MNREQKVQLLKKIINGQAVISDLKSQKEFELWVNVDDPELSNTVFENENGVRLSRKVIELNSLNKDGAINNIFIIGMYKQCPLASRESDVII